MLAYFLRVGPDNYINYIRSYQAIQHTDNEVELKVVREDNFDENIHKKLKNDLSDLFGDDINISITITDEIKCETSGKKLTIKSKC